MQVQELSVVNPIITANWLHLKETRTQINFHDGVIPDKLRKKPDEFIKHNRDLFLVSGST